MSDRKRERVRKGESQREREREREFTVDMRWKEEFVEECDDW